MLAPETPSDVASESLRRISLRIPSGDSSRNSFRDPISSFPGTFLGVSSNNCSRDYFRAYFRKPLENFYRGSPRCSVAAIFRGTPSRIFPVITSGTHIFRISLRIHSRFSFEESLWGSFFFSDCSKDTWKRILSKIVTRDFSW